MLAVLWAQVAVCFKNAEDNRHEPDAPAKKHSPATAGTGEASHR
jgi:hypothetical protein